MRGAVSLLLCSCIMTCLSCASRQQRQPLAQAAHDLKDDVKLVARVIHIEEAQPGFNAGVYLDLLVREVFEDAGNKIAPGDRIRILVPTLHVVSGLSQDGIPVRNSFWGYLVVFRDAFDWDYCGRLSMWEWNTYEAAPPVASVATVISVVPSPPWPNTVLVTLKIERVCAYHGKPYVSSGYVEVFVSSAELWVEGITPEVIRKEHKALYIDPYSIWRMWDE